jgi:hypothetical protein
VTEEEKAAPLHSKPVKTLNLDHLLELAKGHPLEARLIELIRWVRDPQVFEGDMGPKAGVKSVIDPHDIDKMIEDGLAEKISQRQRKRVRRWAKSSLGCGQPVSILLHLFINGNLMVMSRGFSVFRTRKAMLTGSSVE